MSSYVPPNVGPAGLTIPGYEDILNDNLEQYTSIFGANQYIGTDSAIYQLIAILSLKQSDTMQALQYAYNQSSPTTAIGAGLDRLVKLNGIARKPFSFSTAIVTVNGTPGTVINNGAAQDTNGNTWNLPATVTIPGSGNVNVSATCTIPGNIVAEPNTITIIATPVGGWTSVTNAAVSTPGVPIETDSQLRARQAISVAVPSKTLLAGTIADLAALPGVTRYNVLENPTNAVDVYGNPPHSITAVVEGATDAAVAQTIYNNRGIGCFTNGTDTVVVTDPTNGNITMPISFDRPTYIPIYVTMTVHGFAGFTSATLAQIATDIVNYLNSLQIGENVVFSEIYGAALNARPNPDAPLFSIRSVFTGVAASPSGVADIALLFNQVAQGVAANIVVTTV
jgi:uncharacterized phage protein gp47/JayE